MIEKTGNRFNGWLPFYGSLGAAVVLLPKMVFGNDITTFLLSVLVAAIVGVILLVILFPNGAPPERGGLVNGSDFWLALLANIQGL
jgi:hypothetical protein